MRARARARPSAAIENDIVRSSFVGQRECQLPFALHVRRQHTGTHTCTCCSARTLAETEDSRLPSCLPSCHLALAVAQKCMLHFMPRLQLVCLHLFLYVSLSLSFRRCSAYWVFLRHLRNAPEYTRVCELRHILWHFDA